MSTPPPAQTPGAQTKPGGPSARPAARRAAALPAKPRPDYRLPIAAAVLALLLGFVLGLVYMRHRRAATEVVASVNGAVISKDDLFSKLQSTAGQATVHRMVEEDLQLQFAKQKGVVPTEAEIDAQFARDKQNPDFEKALTARGLTPDVYRDALRVRLAQAQVYAQGVTISDAEVRQWYNTAASPSNPAATYYSPETVNLSVISVPTAALAQRAMKELNAGTPFPLVATAYSNDNSKAQGGAIQPLIRGRNPVSKTPALEAALFKLPVGGTYGPVEFSSLQWIFHCNAKTPSQTLPFSAVEAQARQNALAAKGAKINGSKIAKEFADFQHAAKIKSFWPQYEKAVSSH